MLRLLNLFRLSRACGLADYEFWGHDDLGWKLSFAVCDAVEKDLRAALAHLGKRLADGGQRGREVGCGLNVVEAYH